MVLTRILSPLVIPHGDDGDIIELRIPQTSGFGVDIALQQQQQLGLNLFGPLFLPAVAQPGP